MISENKLKEIESTISEAVNSVNKAVEWVNTYEKDGKQLKSLYELKTERIELNRLKEVVTKKPVVALFGASQVGKSYMANNLLYDSENKLEVFDHRANSNIDFLAEINPVGGGNEATGAITRFTSDRELKSDRLPVKIKVFQPIDIICILCDTYFNDYEGDKNKITSLNKEYFENLIANLESLSEPINQKNLIDDDVFIIKQYFEKYSKDSAAVSENLSVTNYWNILAERIHKIPYKNWNIIFRFLWNEKPEISNIFEIALSALNDLRFETVLYADYSSILRKSEIEGKFYPIINVHCFHKFFDENIERIKIQSQNGELLNVHSSRLGYLTAEIVLSVSSGSIENRPFIKNVDIIDFPGARSRLKNTQLDDGTLIEMVKRGKVAYLFNKYSANYQTNILMVCVRTEQTGANTVPGLINDWVKQNLGDNAQSRTKNLTSEVPPLFVIITWWNKVLVYERGSNVIEQRITNTFNTRLYQELYIDVDWHTSWKSNGEGFKNHYMLRDFTRSGEIFVKNELGYETIEAGNHYPSEEQKLFYEGFREHYLNFHKTSNLFQDPEKSFNESSVAGRDGSEWILQNLSKIANNNYTTHIYLKKIISSLEKVRKVVNEKYHSDNQDEQIRKNAKDGAALQLNMDIVFGKNAFLFGDFIEKLLITESEIFEFYHELLQSDEFIKSQDTNEYILIRTQNPELHPDKSFDENLEILRKNYKFENTQETLEYFERGNIDLNQLFKGDLYNLQNNSVILADAAQHHWFENKLTIKNFSQLIEQKIDSELLANGLSVFKRLFENLEVNKIIASHIREYVDVQQRIDRAEDMIAHITAGIINKFVNSAGWAFFSQAKKEELAETNAKNKLNLKLPDEKKKFESIVRSSDNEADITVEKLIDYMDKLNENLNKKPIDISVAKHVPMIMNYQQWINNTKIAFVAVCKIPNYDPDANLKMKIIIDDLNKVEVPSLNPVAENAN